MKNRVIIAIITILVLSIIIAGRNIFGNLFSGKVYFSDEYVGNVIRMKDGHNFTIFRRLKVDGQNDNPKNLTIFLVRFKFRNLSNKANKHLSIIPASFLIGMEGFREKFWAINENTKEFEGIYQWSSLEAAERYPETFIFKLMTKRAAPGTVSYEIIPDTDIVEFVTGKNTN